MRRYRRYQNNDPREITARFNSFCAETGKPISEGDTCIYYPLGKKVYHVDSQQAREYREMKADQAMGFNY